MVDAVRDCVSPPLHTKIQSKILHTTDHMDISKRKFACNRRNVFMSEFNFCFEFYDIDLWRAVDWCIFITSRSFAQILAKRRRNSLWWCIIEICLVMDLRTYMRTERFSSAKRKTEKRKRKRIAFSSFIWSHSQNQKTIKIGWMWTR